VRVTNARRRGSSPSAVSVAFGFSVNAQVLAFWPPLLQTPDQITSRWLVAWSVMPVPTAKVAAAVLPVGTLSPAGVEVTRSPPRPVAVRVSVAVVAAAPHTLGTPPPPQVCGA